MNDAWRVARRIAWVCGVIAAVSFAGLLTAGELVEGIEALPWVLAFVAVTLASLVALFFAQLTMRLAERRRR